MAIAAQSATDTPATKQKMCIKCNTEYTSNHFSRLNLWTGCPKCAQEAKQKWEDEERQEEEQRRARLWKRKVERSNIPLRFRAKTLEEFEANNDRQKFALDFARSYTSNIPEVMKTGQSAIFVGGVGTGKTHLASAIAFAYMRSGREALYSTVMEAIRRVKDSWRSKSKEAELLQAFVAPHLLILDEVGVQFGSETERMFLFDMLNGRYNNRKPSILISNLTMPEVTDIVGERIIDRFAEDNGQVIVFDWQSHRMQNKQK